MDNKQAYTQKIDAQINQWSARIDQLKAKAQEAGADATIDYNKRISDLEDRMSAVAEKKKELENAATDNWDRLKEQAESVVQDTRDAFERIGEKVSS